MKILRFNSRVNKTFARDLIRISSRSFIFVGNPERLVATEKIVFNRYIEGNNIKNKSIISCFSYSYVYTRGFNCGNRKISLYDSIFYLHN